jgi:hypothetical protein
MILATAIVWCFLRYTDFQYSNVSVLSSFAMCQSSRLRLTESRGYNKLQTINAVLMNCASAPNTLKCQSETEALHEIAVIVPAFKRDSISEIVISLLRHRFLPRGSASFRTRGTGAQLVGNSEGVDGSDRPLLVNKLEL